jgi:hypothetical protein
MMDLNTTNEAFRDSKADRRTQKQLAEAFLVRRGEHGATGWEVAQALQIQHGSGGAVLNKLGKAGLAHLTSERRIATKHRAQVWVAGPDEDESPPTSRRSTSALNARIAELERTVADLEAQNLRLARENHELRRMIQRSNDAKPRHKIRIPIRKREACRSLLLET